MAVITEEEKLRRRRTVQSVLGTSAMEGVFLDASVLALMVQFEDGMLEIEQLSEAIDLHVREMTTRLTSADSPLERVAVDAA